MTDEPRRFTHILGLTGQRRLPRLGFISKGRQVTIAGGKTRTEEAGHFVFSDESIASFPEIIETYADRKTGEIAPQCLHVMLPCEHAAQVFPQCYKLLGKGAFTFCRGDGQTAIESVCAECGQLRCAHRDAERVDRERACPCDQLGKSGGCKPEARLRVILYRVTRIGIWEIETHSWNSVRNINSALLSLREDPEFKRISNVPLELRLVKCRLKHAGMPTWKHLLFLGPDHDETVLSHWRSRQAGTYQVDPPDDAHAPNELPEDDDDPTDAGDGPCGEPGPQPAGESVPMPQEEKGPLFDGALAESPETEPESVDRNGLIRAIHDSPISDQEFELAWGNITDGRPDAQGKDIVQLPDDLLIALHREVQRMEVQPPAQPVNTRAPARAEAPPTCPTCNGAMKLRNSARGQFWGCTQYPNCKGTRPKD